MQEEVLALSLEWPCRKVHTAVSTLQPSQTSRAPQPKLELLTFKCNLASSLSTVCEEQPYWGQTASAATVVPRLTFAMEGIVSPTSPLLRLLLAVPFFHGMELCATTQNSIKSCGQGSDH